MNVWEQIRLFLGDLSLALYERESQVGLTLVVRESEGKTNNTTRRMVEEKGSCCFLRGGGEKKKEKKKKVGRWSEWLSRDGCEDAPSLSRVEWRVQRVIRPIWSFWVTTDQGRRLCGDVVMSLAVEDPRGTSPPLPCSIRHTHKSTHTKSSFWVRRSHVREIRIRLHPILMEVGQRLAAGRIDQSGQGEVPRWAVVSHKRKFSLRRLSRPFWLMHRYQWRSLTVDVGVIRGETVQHDFAWLVAVGGVLGDGWESCIGKATFSCSRWAQGQNPVNSLGWLFKLTVKVTGAPNKEDDRRRAKKIWREASSERASGVGCRTQGDHQKSLPSFDQIGSIVLKRSFSLMCTHVMER